MKTVVALSVSLAFLILVICAPAHAQSSGPAGLAASAPWSEAVVVSSGWETWPSINSDGTRVVALDADPAVSHGQKRIVFFERTAAGWGGPQVVASNGAAQDSGWLPQYTHPVLSGDGRTVAYLGATGQSAPDPQYAVYVVDQTDGAWGAPVAVPTGLLNPHYFLALRGDGDAVVYNSYLLWDPVWPMYVSERSVGAWGERRQLSNEWGGAEPAMSADGTAMAYLATNSRLMFVEKIGDAWAAPVLLVDNNPDESNLEHPTISADGRSIFYWKVQLEPAGGYYLRTAQDLYVLRRQGTGWTAPMKVTATSVIPNAPTDAPAATDAHGTRVIYSRPRAEGDLIVGATLEMTEFISGAWTAPAAVTDFMYYANDKHSRLSEDGKRLVYEADHYTYNGTHGLREKTTAADPPAPEQPALVQGLIWAATPTNFVAGSTMLSFPAGAFTSTVQLTYTQLATAGALAADQLVPLGYEFELSAIYTDTGKAASIAPGGGYTISIERSAINLGLVSSTTVQLYRWNGAGWTQEGITPDEEISGTRIVARADRLGRFAVFGHVRSLYLPLVMR